MRRNVAFFACFAFLNLLLHRASCVGTGADEWTAWRAIWVDRMFPPFLVHGRPSRYARPSPAEITLFGFSLMVGKAIYKLQIEQLL